MAGTTERRSSVPTGSHYLSRWAKEVEAKRPDPLSVWQRYNFAAISPANMVQAANMFYRTGKISLSELGRLILMPAAAECPANGRLAYGPAWMTQGTSAVAPRNYLADLANQIAALARQEGMEAELAASQSLLGKLNALQADMGLATLP